MKLRRLFGTQWTTPEEPAMAYAVVSDDISTAAFGLTSRELDAIVTEHFKPSKKPEFTRTMNGWNYKDESGGISHLPGEQIEKAAEAIYYECLKRVGQMNSWYAPSVPEEMREDYRALAIKAAPHLQFPLRDATNAEIDAIVADSQRDFPIATQHALNFVQCRYALSKWRQRVNNREPKPDPRRKKIERLLYLRFGSATADEVSEVTERIISALDSSD